ncbi:MAG: hypothetical protein AB7F31_07310 [Parachlamydiales bacterium]
MKKAEGRVYGQMLRNWKLQSGDHLKLGNRTCAILCEVVFLHVYKSFQEMLKGEGIGAMLPQIEKQTFPSEEAKMKAAIKVYEGFPGSDRVRDSGAVAIGVKFIKDL